MNSPRPYLALILFLISAALASLQAATPVIGTQLFQETDARIENLFQYRINPPKPPALADNPFNLGDPPAKPISPSSNGPVVLPPDASDDLVLRLAANNLVFGGLLQVGDVQVLVINKGSYKQGGILGVRVLNTLVYLRIVSITTTSVTLGLNEARLTLRF